jgi:hypothetical protein
VGVGVGVGVGTADAGVSPRPRCVQAMDGRTGVRDPPYPPASSPPPLPLPCRPPTLSFFTSPPFSVSLPSLPPLEEYVSFPRLFSVHIHPPSSRPLSLYRAVPLSVSPVHFRPRLYFTFSLIHSPSLAFPRAGRAAAGHAAGRVRRGPPPGVHARRGTRPAAGAGLPDLHPAAPVSPPPPAYPSCPLALLSVSRLLVPLSSSPSRSSASPHVQSRSRDPALLAAAVVKAPVQPPPFPSARTFPLFSSGSFAAGPRGRCPQHPGPCRRAGPSPNRCVCIGSGGGGWRSLPRLHQLPPAVLAVT